MSVSSSARLLNRVGKPQRKYVYEVHVKSLDLRRSPPSRGATSDVAVLWTRGSKQAMTSERPCAMDGEHEYGESLSLICTLFSAEAARSSKDGVARFQEKFCTFAAIEPRTGSGAHAAGSSWHAEPDHRPQDRPAFAAWR